MKLDKEYRTCFFREVEYLRSKGIYPSFSKWEENTKIYKFKEIYIFLPVFA